MSVSLLKGYFLLWLHQLGVSSSVQCWAGISIPDLPPTVSEASLLRVLADASERDRLTPQKGVIL
jgi:hypothetical protein